MSHPLTPPYPSPPGRNSDPRRIDTLNPPDFMRQRNESPSTIRKRQEDVRRFEERRGGQELVRVQPFRPRCFPIHRATWIEDGSAVDNSQDTHLRGRTSTANPNRRIALKFPQPMASKDSTANFHGIAWDCEATLRVQDWEQRVGFSDGGLIRGTLFPTLIYDWAGLDVDTLTWANQGDLKTVSRAPLYLEGSWAGNSGAHVQAGDGGTIVRKARFGFFFENAPTNTLHIQGILFQVLLFGSFWSSSYFEVTFEVERSKGIYGVWNPRNL